VRGGVPFREAHRRTGALLKELAAHARTVRDLTPEEWQTFGVAGGAALLDPDASVRARTMPGGPSPVSVTAQADAVSAALAARAGRD
jgi:argininosuccinate lyase